VARIIVRLLCASHAWVLMCTSYMADVYLLVGTGLLVAAWSESRAHALEVTSVTLGLKGMTHT